MFPAVLAMLAILAVALLIMGMVVVGLQGEGRWRAPEIVNGLAEVGRHLNGDATPPKALLALLDDSSDGARDRRKPSRRERKAATAVALAPASSASWAAPEIAQAWERHTDAPSASAWSGAVAAPPVSGWETDSEIAPEFDTLLGGEGLSSAWANEATHAPRPVTPQRRPGARPADPSPAVGTEEADPAVPTGGAWASWTPDR